MWRIVLLCCALQASLASRLPANASDLVARTGDRIHHGGEKAAHLLNTDELDMERNESLPSQSFGSVDMERNDSLPSQSFGIEAMPALHRCATPDRRARKALKTRRKRSVSSVPPVRHLELLLVADASMAKKHGKNLHQYLLDLTSMASKTFDHPSFGNILLLSVVKVTVLSKNERGIDVSTDASATLKSFCKWQNQQSHQDEDHPHHHDAAILFTRLDLCRQSYCGTLGVATVGAVCSPERSCAVVKDKGLETAHILAHEIGHLLGLRHDDSFACLLNFGRIKKNHLMFSEMNSIDTSKPWSPCSSATIRNIFNDGEAECLLDAPQIDLLGPGELLGQRYNGDQQCQAAFGPDYYACPRRYVRDLCPRLWCDIKENGQVVHQSTNSPAFIGTPCGYGGTCQEGKCVGESGFSSFFGGLFGW